MSAPNKLFITKKELHITEKMHNKIYSSGKASPGFSMHACPALETIMVLRQEVTDFVLDYGCCQKLSCAARF